MKVPIIAFSILAEQTHVNFACSGTRTGRSCRDVLLNLSSDLPTDLLERSLSSVDRPLNEG